MSNVVDTAVYESGHVVAALVLRHPVLWVTAADAVGNTQIKRESAGFDGIVVCVAGAEAERLSFGEGHNCDASNDNAHATKLAYELTGNLDRSDELVGAAHVRARELLREHSGTLIRLDLQLRTNRKIWGDEFAVLLT